MVLFLSLLLSTFPIQLSKTTLIIYRQTHNVVAMKFNKHYV